jgi:hypothetical protein
MIHNFLKKGGDIMGLDMFAYATERSNVRDDFSVIDKKKMEEIYYWNNHRFINRWMSDLFTEKNGPGFYCGELIRLDINDLIGLYDYIQSNSFNTSLPKLSNSLIPMGIYNKKDKMSDVAFVEKAMRFVTSGCAVYYCSSW